ncbi:hypothetical protein [Nodosilinea nodulosa]|uniref:hypothetical protein n=1 Tax=Nodosilinea nodulosa TaxID=416001 RepID=UPI0012D7A99C|nr:hypothetical protein [Nodosilinea nodulosa]
MADNQVFDRAFAGVATAAVVAAIAAGFWVLGTPGQQRQIAADRQRVQDIVAIAQEFHNRYLNDGADKFRLPSALDEAQVRNDPMTGQPYEYERLSDRTFELCATFDTDSSTHRLSDQGSNPDAERWQHPAGHYCFEFDVTLFPALGY